MRLPLRVMQPISVQVHGTGDEAWHPSLVLDFAEGRHIQIGVLMHRGEEVRLDAGTSVALEIPLPDGIRRCDSVVQALESSPPSLRLEWPQEAQRIQRRDNVREETVFRVEARVTMHGQSYVVAAYSMDLSVGGIRISASEALPTGASVALRLQVPELGLREVGGRVLRTGDKTSASGEPAYWAAIEFLEVPDALRRELTKVVFDIQREQMRKGVV